MLLPTEPTLWKHMPDVLLTGKKPWHLNEQKNCYFGALRAFGSDLSEGLIMDLHK